jgi:putative transposase
MARHPRVSVPGVALHVIQRGNNRSACFLQDGDYLTYLAYLRHLSTKYQCDVHAYCLMTNHVHLLLTPNESEGCGLFMRDLGRCYVGYFNRRHGRTGTLWEGRFRSSLVESAHYVLACYRYIELNPVRASMVDAPERFAWSSHGVNAGMRADRLIKPHCEFLALGADDATRQDAYRGLFEQAFDVSLLKTIREATNGGYPMASDSFKAGTLMPLGYRIEPGKPGPRVEMPESRYDFQAG